MCLWPIWFFSLYVEDHILKEPLNMRMWCNSPAGKLLTGSFAEKWPRPRHYRKGGTNINKSAKRNWKLWSGKSRQLLIDTILGCCCCFFKNRRHFNSYFIKGNVLYYMLQTVWGWTWTYMNVQAVTAVKGSKRKNE